MPKFTGDKANFDFAGSTYYCLTDGQLSRSVQDASAQCSSSTGAVTHHAGGAEDSSFTFNVLVDADDVTTLNALDVGNTGAFSYHPQGAAATGNIEYDATNAVITQSNLAVATGSLTVLTVTIVIDGALTIQAVP